MTTTTHRDLNQRYGVDGFFRTLCRCGHRSLGITPDDADFAHFEHVDDESAAA